MMKIKRKEEESEAEYIARLETALEYEERNNIKNFLAVLCLFSFAILVFFYLYAFF